MPRTYSLNPSALVAYNTTIVARQPMLAQFTLESPSGRIALVPPDQKYDREVAVLRAHPGTRRYLSFFPEEQSLEDAIALREGRKKEETCIDFVILFQPSSTDGVEQEPQFTGQTGLFHLDHTHKSCAAGILIHPDFHRGGVATETLYLVLKLAFEDEKFKMHRVVFETSPRNVPMRGWLESFGIPHEFTFREAWKTINKEQWEDVVGYCILEKEWQETVKDRLEARVKRYVKAANPHS